MMKKNVRILFISTYFLPYLSGLTVYPYRLFKRLVKKGYVVQVVTFLHRANLPKKETIEGIAIERAHYWFKISKGFFAPFFIFSIFKKVKQAEVIIINQPSIEGISAIILGRILRKKIISLYYCSLQTNHTIVQKMIDRAVNMVVFIELFMSHVVVVTSADYIKKTLITIFNHKMTIIMPPIIHYSVSSKIYADYIRQKANNTWIGFCGRISHEKGLEYLIAAYEEIRVSMPLATIVFAGPYGREVAGERWYYQKIKRMMKETHIPHHFFGCLRTDEIGAFYKAIDCLVLPSVNNTEAFGMVQAEAMVCGTPVIATDRPGVRVPIKLTGMGLVVPRKNPHKIARAIVHVIEYRSQFTDKKKIATAQKIFTISIFFEKWDYLLQQIKTKRSLEM